VPTGFDEVAVVAQTGTEVSDAEVSLFTKPEYEGVIAGTAEPYVEVGEEAVTRRLAGVIVAVPPTYVIV
jgi:hypothetical protein